MKIQELDKLLEGVGTGNVTAKEAKYLEEMNNMRLRGSKLYPQHLQKYFKKKRGGALE